MTIMEMLEQSGVLTVLGMGVVFGFLITMIICVSAMGKIIHALGLAKDTHGGAPVPSPASVPVKSTAVVAAITAAVSEYRKEN